MTANVLMGQKLKLGDTDKMIEFGHTPKKLFLALESSTEKEMIWSKSLTFKPNSDVFDFKSTVYPTINDSRHNPYAGAKIINADFKDLDDGSSMCLVLIELDYKHKTISEKTWIGPVKPARYGRQSIRRLGEDYGKKNYLLRSFIKKEKEWKPYLSCYLDSVWYDLIGVPVDEIRIHVCKYTSKY